MFWLADHGMAPGLTEVFSSLNTCHRQNLQSFCCRGRTCHFSNGKESTLSLHVPAIHYRAGHAVLQTPVFCIQEHVTNTSKQVGTFQDLFSAWQLLWSSIERRVLKQHTCVSSHLTLCFMGSYIRQASSIKIHQNIIIFFSSPETQSGFSLTPGVSLSLPPLKEKSLDFF